MNNKTNKGRLAGRIALITGAGRGLGRAVALEMAKEGAHIIALGRHSNILEKLDDDIKAVGGTATLIPSDLMNGDGLDQVGHDIFKRWGKIDIVVGNAGVLGPLSPIGHIKPDKWDELLAVNLTANYRLIRSMDMLLRKSDAGRVIMVSSSAANKANPFWGGYGTTKAALEMLTLTYANEMIDTDVKINVINPGPTRTKMRAQAFPGEDPETLTTPEEVAKLFIELADPNFKETGKVYSYPEWSKK
jgi:NAD(P)-dependent dehydrogenase (short-subunit alcohol dehydrogenase family)